MTRVSFFLWVLVVWGLLGPLGSLAAQPASGNETVIDRALTLRGGTAKTAFKVTLHQPATPAHPATLSLVWEVSGVVSPKLSSLGVFVDDRPVRHARLSQLPVADGVQRWDVPLRGFDAGDHLIEIRSTLKVEGDPCLETYRDAAWLTLQTRSKLRHPAAPTHLTATTLLSLPDAWRERSTTIRLDVPSDVTAERALGFLEAASLLRHWGLEPTLGAALSPAGSFRMRSLDDDLAGMPAALLEELTRTPEALAVAGLVGLDLWVIGRRPNDLQSALQQLRSDRVRRLCGSPCLLSDSHETPIEPPPQRDPHDPRVLALRDIGHAHSWVARGQGTHSLRMVWTRPAWWTITRAPVFELISRMPDQKTFDGSRSSLNVKFNEIPLATWDLGQRNSGQGVMRVRIPEEFWKDSTWVIDIDVLLQTEDREECAYVSDSNLWVTLDPESALYVERNESQFTGLASFYDAARTQRPALLWQRGAKHQELLALGAVLEPLADATPDARWTLVTERTQGKSLYVSLAPNVPRPPLVRVSTAPRSLWLDESNKLGIPLVDLSETVRMSRLQEGDSVTLVVQTGDLTHESSVAPPDLAQLISAHALWHGKRWYALGKPEPVGSPYEVHNTKTVGASEERLESENETLFQIANIIWLALATCIIVFTVWWVKRTPKPSPRAGLAIEESLDDH